MVPLLALLVSCNTPDSVARFCSSAVSTLGSGDALFDDMKASCIREAQTRESFGTFALTDPDPAVCDDIGKQAEGLKAASKVLLDYFKALNDLASFGASKAGDDAKELVAKASAQSKLSADRQTAMASIAGFLTRVATSGYQQRQLADDVVRVHKDIQVSLDGLGEVVGVAYLHQLQNEEQKTATRYNEFLLQHQGAADAALILDARWQNDRANFAARQKAALAYKAALETLAKGNEELAAHARGFKAKDLAGLLSSYAAQLDSLAPAIRKAYF